MTAVLRINARRSRLAVWLDALYRGVSQKLQPLLVRSPIGRAIGRCAAIVVQPDLLQVTAAAPTKGCSLLRSKAEKTDEARVVLVADVLLKRRTNRLVVPVQNDVAAVVQTMQTVRQKHFPEVINHVENAPLQNDHCVRPAGHREGLDRIRCDEALRMHSTGRRVASAPADNAWRTASNASAVETDSDPSAHLRARSVYAFRVRIADQQYIGIFTGQAEAALDAELRFPEAWPARVWCLGAANA